MKTNVAIFALLTSLIAVSFSANSAEKITGAFGINFGTLLGDVNVIKSHVNSRIHSVEPPNPMSLLRFYTVETEGKEKRIYRITGLTLENSRMACLEDLATVTAILEDKYGKLENFKTSYRFQDESRSVIASCDREGGDNSRKIYNLKVTYEDRSFIGGAGGL